MISEEFNSVNSHWIKYYIKIDDRLIVVLFWPK